VKTASASKSGFATARRSDAKPAGWPPFRRAAFTTHETGTMPISSSSTCMPPTRPAPRPGIAPHGAIRRARCPSFARIRPRMSRSGGSCFSRTADVTPIGGRRSNGKECAGPSPGAGWRPGCSATPAPAFGGGLHRAKRTHGSATQHRPDGCRLFVVDIGGGEGPRAAYREKEGLDAATDPGGRVTYEWGGAWRWHHTVRVGF